MNSLGLDLYLKIGHRHIHHLRNQTYFKDKFFVTFAKTNEDNHPDDDKIEDNLEL